MAIKKRTKYVSKGERRAMSTEQRNQGRRERKADKATVTLNQQKALAKGKDIIVTVPNSNKENTKERFVKEKISGKDYIKHSKKMQKFESKESVQLEVVMEMAKKGLSFDPVRCEYS